MFSGADVLFRFTFLEGLNFGCLRPPYFDSSPPPRFSLVVCCAPRALLCTMQTTCFFCEPDVFTLLVWSVCASARVKSTYGGAKKRMGGSCVQGGPSVGTHTRARVRCGVCASPRAALRLARRLARGSSLFAAPPVPKHLSPTAARAVLRTPHAAAQRTHDGAGAAARPHNKHQPPRTLSLSLSAALSA